MAEKTPGDGTEALKQNTGGSGPAAPIHAVVKASGWVSFFTDLGSELIYPLLPQFVTETLKAPKAVFGLIEGLAEGIPSIMKYFSGAIADRVRNRKWLILAGYGISSLVKPFIGLAEFVALAFAPFVVLICRVLDKIGKGIRGAPRDALVADYSEGIQGRAFGYQRAMDHAGAVAGGVSAFILIGLLKMDIAWAIGLAFIPGLITIIVITLFIHDNPGRRGTLHVPSMSAGDDLSARAHAMCPYVPDERRVLPGLGRPFYLYLVSDALFSLANSSDVFLLIRAREMGIKDQFIPLAWALLHVVKSATSYSGGSLSDRTGRKPLLMFGWSLYAVVYFGFSVFKTAGAAWLLFPIYGIFYGATEGVAKAFVADLIPSGTRGRAFGVLGAAEGLVLIPASIVVGWLWDLNGTGEVALGIEAGLALMAALWLAILVKPIKKNELGIC